VIKDPVSTGPGVYRIVRGHNQLGVSSSTRSCNTLHCISSITGFRPVCNARRVPC